MNYNIHDLVRISTTEDIPNNVQSDIDFQIKYFQTDHEPKCKYYIQVKPFSQFSGGTLGNASDIFHLLEGQTGLTLIDPIKKFAVTKLSDGFEIYVSKKSFLVNFYIQLLFLKEGISMVHAAAVGDHQGNVILFPGPGGVGKTAIINYFIREKGYQTLGDDIIGLGEDGTCYAFPREFVLKKYHQNVYPEVFRKHGYKFGRGIDKKTFYYLELIFYRLIFKNLPFQGIISSIVYRLGLVNLFKKKKDFFTVPISEVFGDNSVLERGKLSQLIFLERFKETESQLMQVSHDRMTQIMFAIINHEWVDFMREIFSLGALEVIDLHEYMKRTHQNIQNALRHIEEYHFLKIPEGASPEELVKIYNKSFKD